jgi:hypothetical protein
MHLAQKQGCTVLLFIIKFSKEEGVTRRRTPPSSMWVKVFAWGKRDKGSLPCHISASSLDGISQP